MQDAAKWASSNRKYGIVPNKEHGATVFSFGCTLGTGSGTAAVHIITWIGAIVLSFISYMEVDNMATPDQPDGQPDGVKMLFMGQTLLSCASLVAASSHACLENVKNEQKDAPLFGVFLIFFVLATLVISAANVAIASSWAERYRYLTGSASLLCTLASAMLLSFYTNLTRTESL